MKAFRVAVALVVIACVGWFGLIGLWGGDQAPAFTVGSVDSEPEIVGPAPKSQASVRELQRGFVLQVVGDAGQSIAGATVVVQGRSAALVASEAGVVALGNVGSNAVMLVRAAGFQPRVVIKDDLPRGPSGVASITLQVAATLRVQAVASGGAPVAGVRLRLLPQPISGVWGHNWKRLSDTASLEQALARAAGHLRREEQIRQKDSGAVSPSTASQSFGTGDLLLVPEREVILASNAEMVLGGGGSAASGPLGALLSGVTLPGKYAFLFSSLDRVTNDSGWATWNELPPHPCELGIDSVFWADQDDSRFLDVSWLRGQDTSRAIDLIAGSVSRIVLQVPGESDWQNTVVGCVAATVVRWASVSVYHESTVAATHGGLDYELSREESSCIPNAAGRFLFQGIHPGRKAVRAKWSEDGRDVCFASAGGVLVVDGQLDVGALNPRPGPVMEVAIGHRGVNGQLINPSDSELKGKQFALRVETLGDDLDMIAGISDYIPVEVGDVVRLIGATAGRVSLRLAWFGGDAGAGVFLKRAALPVYNGRAEESPFVRLDIDTLQYAEVAIDMTWPVGFAQRSVMLHLLSENSDVEQVEVTPNQKSVRLRAGQWDILAESSLFPSGTDSGVFARLDQVGVGLSTSPTTLHLPLRPAVAISGSVKAGFMAHRSSRALFWKLSPGDVIYSTLVDTTGAFRLEGLPTNAVFKGVKGLADLATQSAGEQELVLR